MTTLRITEIFCSLQGESTTVGTPTTFIRLTGCPLRCAYCDTAYAFQGGRLWTIDDVLLNLAQYRTQHVTVTGGEPLAQPGCRDLIQTLCDDGKQVALETSGALPIDSLDARTRVVMDLKTPASGEEQRNRYANLACLKQGDEIKFVLMNREDYEWAVQLIHARKIDKMPVVILFSPAYGEIEPRQLAEWILADQLPVRLQIQLHKLLWGETPGH